MDFEKIGFEISELILATDLHLRLDLKTAPPPKLFGYFVFIFFASALLSQKMIPEKYEHEVSEKFWR